MFFSYDITIPANTTAASPKTQTLKLAKGIIVGCDVKFEYGCLRHVDVRIFRYESQLVPLSRDEWLTGEGEAIPTEGYYPLTETPAQLKFVGCSPGTTYDHKIGVRVRILPIAVALPYLALKKLADVFARMMRIPITEPKPPTGT